MTGMNGFQRVDEFWVYWAHHIPVRSSEERFLTDLLALSVTWLPSATIWWSWVESATSLVHHCQGRREPSQFQRSMIQCHFHTLWDLWLCVALNLHGSLPWLGRAAASQKHRVQIAPLRKRPILRGFNGASRNTSMLQWHWWTLQTATQTAGQWMWFPKPCELQVLRVNFLERGLRTGSHEAAGFWQLCLYLHVLFWSPKGLTIGKIGLLAVLTESEMAHKG